MALLGHTARLPEGRLVFVGTDDTRERFYLGFINSEKEITRLVLSLEAYTALESMMIKGFDGLLSTVPDELIKREWRLVDSSD